MTSSLEPNQPFPDKRSRRRTGENRERLLQAGIIEFGRHGYHGASTASIGASADVPQPHVYANFRTKQHLFLACVERASTTFNGVTPAPNVIERLIIGHDELSKLIFQAIAVVGEPEMGPPLRTLLLQLQQHHGEAFIPDLLGSVARQALEEQ